MYLFTAATILLVLGNFKSSIVESAAPCAQRSYTNGIVCVCNSTYCDTIDPVSPTSSNEYVTYVSSSDGLRFEKSTGEFDTSTSGDYVLTINASQTYQTILGFGGSFTDAFGINVVGLSEAAREKLLRSYFSDEGLEYTLCRVPIGGTDFSTHGYSYCDTEEEDKNLDNFSLADEDYAYKIPLIKTANELASNQLKLIASAWTPPKWMKTNNEFAGMFGFLKSDMYQVWANYILKFFESYKDNGIEYWGLTTANEPSLAFFVGNKIPTTGWWPWDMRRWIAENLGPTIKQSQFSHLKIIGIDDQVFLFPWLPKYLVSNATVNSYLEGFSVHWYWNLFLGREWLTKTHEALPDKFIISGEACTGSYLVRAGVRLGSWLRGALYAADIVKDLNRYVSAWIDWNMALDLEGGPTYISNIVDSPIVVNATADEFYKNPMYYALGHFSKFIPPGSIRINLDDSGSSLHSVAFKRPDNGIAIVLVNNGFNQVPVTISDKLKGNINLNVDPLSFTTVLYW